MTRPDHATPARASRPSPVAPKLTPKELCDRATRAVEQGDEFAALEIAAHPAADTRTLLELAQSPFWRVRIRITDRDELDDELLILLSSDSDKHVAGPIAEWETLPDEAWLHLMMHPAYPVRRSVEERDDVPESVIARAYQHLCQEPNEDLAKTLGAGRSTPPALLHVLKDGPYWRAIERICENPRTHGQTLHAIMTGDITHRELLGHPKWKFVVEKIASHRNLTEQDRLALSKHAEWIVREKIALRDHLSPDEVIALGGDQHWQVREKIALRENLPAGLHRALLGDVQDEVRSAAANPESGAERRRFGPDRIRAMANQRNRTGHERSGDAPYRG